MILVQQTLTQTQNLKKKFPRQKNHTAKVVRDRWGGVNVLAEAKFFLTCSFIWTSPTLLIFMQILLSQRILLRIEKHRPNSWNSVTSQYT